MTNEQKKSEFGNVCKGAKLAASNFKLVIRDGGQVSSVVRILDSTATSSSGKNWMLRFDKPHKHLPSEHININPKITGRIDPHIRISPSQLENVVHVAKVAKKVNKVLIPIAVAMDLHETYVAAKADYGSGTTRNSVTTVSRIAGGWGGGAGGALGGAALGSLYCPVVGTLIGGFVGGMCGGVGGSIGAEATVNAISDKYDYDIETKKCDLCGIEYKYRKYQDLVYNRYYCSEECLVKKIIDGTVEEAALEGITIETEEETKEDELNNEKTQDDKKQD